MTRIWGSLGTAIGIYLLVSALVFLFQRKLQYFPSREDSAGRGRDPFTPLVVSDHFVGYVREVNDPVRVILVFHGNAGEALHRDWYLHLAPKKTVLVLAEYPGYGGATGAPTEESIFRMALGLFDFVTEKYQVPVDVIGESLGSGPACYLAGKRPVIRLGLISPFSSASDVAAYRYPFLPIGILMKDKFESTRWVKSASASMHIIHGSEDEVVPIKLALKLFEAYPSENKQFTTVSGAGHGNMSTAVLESPEGSSFRAFIQK